MNLIKNGDTTKKILLFMADSTAPTSGKTGLTVSVRVSKNGAAFGAGGGTVTELEGGFYSYTPAAADVNTDGPLGVRATATGAVDFAGVRQVVPFDPYSATNLGLSNLDAAVSSRSTFAGGAVASVTAGVTVGGYSAGQDPASLVIKYNVDLNGPYQDAWFLGKLMSVKGQTDLISFDGSNYLNAHTKVNDDKTAYALTSAYDPAKTAAQAGNAMAVTTASGNALVAATAAQVTADHGSGSYVRNTEPPTVGQVAAAVMTDVGDVLGADIVAIKAKTDLLGTASATLTQPLSPLTKALTLVQGDAYTATLNRPLLWNDPTNSWPDLTGATVTLEVASGLLTVTGDAPTPSGSNKQVRAQPTSAQTQTVTAGQYGYAVVATYPSADRVTLAYGTCTVTDSQRN